MINILLALLQISQHQTDIPLRRPRRLELPGQRVLLPWADEHWERHYGWVMLPLGGCVAGSLTAGGIGAC